MQNNFETVNVLGLDFIKATQTEFLELKLTVLS